MTNVEERAPSKTIAIIGGEVAGLCAGCYAQMNGYQARIFEMHTTPGGVCTAWNRSDYTIDGCSQTVLVQRPWRTSRRRSNLAPLHTTLASTGTLCCRSRVLAANGLGVIKSDILG